MRLPALAVLLASMVMLAGCGGSAGTTALTTTSTATAGKKPAGGTVWLCFPGRTPDPCAGNLATTAVAANGSTSVSHPASAANPPIDCFYVYPTISNEDRGNADLEVQLPEIFVAEAQAERFSQVCRVYAPVYRQITNRGLTDPSLHASPLEAYDSVLAAWRDYLAHDNDGRGIVLIGHSQGAYILKHLVQTVLDRSATERKLLVSAILLGGQALEGNNAGDRGSFTHVAPCSSPSQTGCVIAYSSFGQTPPPHARFGRDASSTSHVLCVNPADPGSSAVQPVTPLFPAALLALVGAGSGASAKVGTPWVAYPDLYTAQCRRSGTASWLQITRTTIPGDHRPAVKPLFGAGWGLHATDVNIALTELVADVAAEARAYARGS